MERVREPELMDDDAQAEAYAVADFAGVNQGFVDGFAARFAGFTGRRFVDLGCGPADIPIRLARRYADATVVGVDGARAMLALGEDAVRTADLSSRIRLVCARLPDPLPDTPRFDAVVSNSLLHHLHDPAVLWHEVLALGAPGAAVWIMDLTRPASTDDARHLVDTYAAGEREVLRTDFYHSLLAAFTPDEIRDQLRAAGLDRALELAVVSDRHVVVSGHLPER